MVSRYGADSPKVKEFEQGKAFSEAFIQHLNGGCRQLESLYAGFRPGQPNAVKDSLKRELIRRIVRSTDTLYRRFPYVKPSKRFREQNLPNNAFFVGFATYNARRNQFEDEFRSRFKGDFRRYLSYLKTKYPSL